MEEHEVRVRPNACAGCASTTLTELRATLSYWGPNSDTHARGCVKKGLEMVWGWMCEECGTTHPRVFGGGLAP